MSAPIAAVPLPPHAELLSVTLDEDGPRAGATAGSPVESSKTLYSDAVCEVGLWSVTPGAFPGAKRGIAEHMLILAGDATIIGDDGTELVLSPGVSFVQPDGWTGRWVVRETVIKQYTIWKTG